MTQTISEFVGQLVLRRCWCGIQFAVPESLNDLQRRQFDEGREMVDIYCPMGHRGYPVGEPEYKRIERELQRERQQHDQTKAILRDEKNVHGATIRSLRSTKGKVTLLKRRAAAGKCPCCHTDFKDLAAHMANKHPGYSE